MRLLRIFIVGVLVLAALFFLLSKEGKAHEDYEKLLDAYGSRCCSDLKRECRAVRSYLGEDDRYYVFLSGRWKVVPESAVILDVRNLAGQSVACADLNDNVFCFFPGQPRS